MRLCTIRSRKGFTLIEVVISIACSSVLLLAIYQMFHSQQKNYITHNESNNMRQNLRTGILLLTKEIKLAGFNPTLTSSVNVGLLSNFPPLNIFGDIGKGDISYLNEKDRIAFSIDKNGDGCINSDNQNPPISCDTVDPNTLVEDGERGEQIAYRIHENKLQRFNSEIYFKTGEVANSWQTIATNIDALNFVFLDQNGDPINNPLEESAPRVRSIDISLLVRSNKKDLLFTNNTIYKNKQGEDICPDCVGDHYRRRFLSTTVRTRNL